MMEGVTMATRRFQVYDGDGELVATFPEWERAHTWAHLRAAEKETRLPVQIEDRSERRTWTIDVDRCRLTVWRRRVEYGYCGRGDVAARRAESTHRPDSTLRPEPSLRPDAGILAGARSSTGRS